MLINYIKNKKPNHENIKNILSLSEQRNHFTNNGPVKAKLEKYLHNLLKLESTKRVLCVANGTLALHAIDFYYQLKNNKKMCWVTTAYTFPSCVVGGMQTQILDINLNDYCFTDDVKNLKEYDGLIITNLFGTYCDIEKWEKFCKDNNKILIIDNASSPLSSYKQKNICNYGDFSFGSLHHTKIIGFGEGGFIVCSNEDYDIMSSILGFGFKGDRKYNQYSSNYKMSDIQAAYILDHMQTFDLQSYLKIQDVFVKELNISGAKLFNYSNDVVYGNLPIVFDNPTSNLVFKDVGIEANKYYLPLSALPNSMFLYDRMVNFPLNEKLQEEEIEIIIREIKRKAKK